MKNLLLKIQAAWLRIPEKLRVWIKGLFAAVEGAVIAVVLQSIAEPTGLHFDSASLHHFGGAVVAGALVAVRMYLTQSPLKPVLTDVVENSLAAKSGK